MGPSAFRGASGLDFPQGGVLYCFVMAGRYYYGNSYGQHQTQRKHKMPARRKWAPKDYEWRSKAPVPEKPKIPKVPEPVMAPLETAEIQTGMDMRTLCQSLASVYTSFIQVTQTQQERERLTRFHSQVEPGIGAEVYLLRLAKYFQCNESCHVLALIYIDRVVKAHPGEIVLNKLTIHRLLAVATVVATKFLDDNFYKNSYYARVCGLTLRELNNLEVFFVGLLNWKMMIPVKDYFEYVSMIKSVNLQ